MDEQHITAQQYARTRVKNLSLAAVAGQAGCVTVMIVFAALLLGFWLDARLNQQGLCLFGTLVASVPVSLFMMLRIALGAIRRITPQAVDFQISPAPSQTKED